MRIIWIGKRDKEAKRKKMNRREEEINRGVPLDRAEEAKLSLFEDMVRSAIVTKWGGN